MFGLRTWINVAGIGSLGQCEDNYCSKTEDPDSRFEAATFKSVTCLNLACACEVFTHVVHERCLITRSTGVQCCLAAELLCCVDMDWLMMLQQYIRQSCFIPIHAANNQILRINFKSSYYRVDQRRQQQLHRHECWAEDRVAKQPRIKPL